MIEAARQPSVSVIVPAYDEAANLDATVDGVIRVLQRMGADHELIVVNDGSGDDTAAVCTRLMAAFSALRVVSHERNEGYGRAVQSGIQASRKDVIVLLPADLQYNFDEIPRLVALTADCDIVAGRRVRRADPLVRRLNAWCWGRLVRAVVNVSVQDVNGGFKAYRRSALDGLEMRATGAMIDAEILVRASRRGARILETPVEHRPRLHGRATGARPSVILRGVYELWTLYPDLRS